MVGGKSAFLLILFTVCCLSAFVAAAWVCVLCVCVRVWYSFILCCCVSYFLPITGAKPRESDSCRASVMLYAGVTTFARFVGFTNVLVLIS